MRGNKANRFYTYIFGQRVRVSERERERERIEKRRIYENVLHTLAIFSSLVSQSMYNP